MRREGWGDGGGVLASLSVLIFILLQCVIQTARMCSHPHAFSLRRVTHLFHGNQPYTAGLFYPIACSSLFASCADCSLIFPLLSFRRVLFFSGLRSPSRFLSRVSHAPISTAHLTWCHSVICPARMITGPSVTPHTLIFL